MVFGSEKNELIFVRNFAKIPALLTLSQFLLCHSVDLVNAVRRHHHEGEQYSICFLPHFACLSFFSLFQRPGSPCKIKSLAATS